MNPRTPVLVGTGQFLNRTHSLDDYIEPLEMMLRAVDLAAEDSRAPRLLSEVQSVRVIRGAWRYGNPARFIAERIGAPGAQTGGTVFGGNYNQTVLSQTCLSIARGELESALLTGAEAGGSGARARKAGTALPETDVPGEFDILFGGDQMPEHHEYEVAHGIRRAIDVYPMYDNAIRHHRRETLEGHLERVSGLWSRFSDVARDNPSAWLRDGYSAEEIRTPSPSNRRVSVPYTKLMNANNAVDMSAALLVCSVEVARRHGIPEERWVYPLAGADGRDHFSASVRAEFHESPGIRFVSRAALELAATEPGDLDFVDLYSCFPSAVQVGAAEIGLEETRPLTVTGGLTFGGGPVNNYVMHSIARMAEVLRGNPGSTGLVTANGGNLYKHAHGVYASRPPEQDFRWVNVQAQIDALPARECLPSFDGDVEVESYTVLFGTEGPAVGHFACRTPDGARVWASTTDPDLMSAMTEEEFCGRAATLSAEGRIDL